MFMAVVLLRSYIVLNDDRVYLRDVRYFHRFGDMQVLRDEETREASHAQLQVHLSPHAQGCSVSRPQPSAET
jgi:hypothetical protein